MVGESYVRRLGKNATQALLRHQHHMDAHDTCRGRAVETMLTGTWMVTNFSSSQNRHALEALSCPFQSNKFMCGHRGRSAGHHHPGLLPATFVPSDADMRTFLSKRSLLTTNRTMFMLGDSLMGQAYRLTMCAIWRAPASTWFHGSISKVPCRIKLNATQQPDCYQVVHHAWSRTTICYLQTLAFDDYVAPLSVLLGGREDQEYLRADDIVVLNGGVHKESDLTRLGPFLHDLVMTSTLRGRVLSDSSDGGHRRSTPRLAWLETMAQHFPVTDGTYPEGFRSPVDFFWHGPKPLNSTINGCQQTINTSDMLIMRGATKVNRLMNRVMRESIPNVTIIPAWELCSSRGADHVGRWKMHYGYDCTHWCEPSPCLNAVASALLSQLACAHFATE
jgi:hypothetical protein